MLNLIIITLAIIIQHVSCEEIINAREDINQISTLININLGSPPIPLSLKIQFGTKSFQNLGQFIIDQSISQTNQKLFEQLKSVGVNQLYDIKKSKTAQIYDVFERQEAQYNGDINGILVDDILSYKNIQTKYKFACAQNISSIQSICYNGLIIFDRLSNNIIDQMYYSNSIRTRDYILSGQKYNTQIGDSTLTQNSIDIIFDLDSKAEYYNTPSNPMISNSDTFQIMSYGIYLDGEDVTDKLKQRKITLDQITDYSDHIDNNIYIPTNLYQLIQEKYNLPYYGENYFKNCAFCQCQEAINLPEITLMTEQYKISIKSEYYVKKSESDCSLHLNTADSFIISSALLFHSDNKIMYQKQSNSIKIINSQLIKHIKLNSVIATFSIFSGTALISLLFISLKWSLKFKLYKQEEQNVMDEVIGYELKKIN
ncbi:hypothetical protein ABPG74_006792 [Tetrahymena malaccensis]